MSADTSSSPLSSDSNSDNNFEEIPNTEVASIDIDTFDKNLPETVSLIRCPSGAKIYIVGTAHFSIESQNDVSKVIQTVQPDILVIELCKSRISILQYDEEMLLEEAKNITYAKMRSTIQQSGVFNGLMHILMLNASAHVTKQMGMAPGGEFRRAFYEAKKLGTCEVRLGDRPIEITIKRAFAKLSWFQTMKLFWNLLTCNDPINKELIEKYKTRDMLEEFFTEIDKECPMFGEVFIRERDRYLTHSLQAAAEPIVVENQKRHPVVVGVVGIGHVPGILKFWPEIQAPFLPEIVIIPPRTLSSKILRLSFKLSLLTFGGYIAYRYVPGTKNVIVYCNSLFVNLLDQAKSIYNKNIQIN